jgi:hypothetical protein
LKFATLFLALPLNKIFWCFLASVISRDFTWCRVISRDESWRFVTVRDGSWWYVTVRDGQSRGVTGCHVMSRDITWCDTSNTRTVSAWKYDIIKEQLKANIVRPLWDFFDHTLARKPFSILKNYFSELKKVLLAKSLLV